MLFSYSRGSVEAFAEVDVVKDSGLNQEDITEAINDNSNEFTSIGGPNFSLDTGSTKVLSTIDNTGVYAHVYRDLFNISETKAKEILVNVLVSIEGVLSYSPTAKPRPTQSMQFHSNLLQPSWYCSQSQSPQV